MRWSRPLIGVGALGLLIAACLTPAAADDKKVMVSPAAVRAPLDAYGRLIDPTTPEGKRWIVGVVVDASRRGTVLFQLQRYQECYQDYVATLFAIYHFITDEALRARVQALAFLAAQENYERACVYMRTALNDIRNRHDLARDTSGKLHKVKVPEGKKKEEVPHLSAFPGPGGVWYGVWAPARAKDLPEGETYLERSLFDRLGGREAVQSIVKLTYDKAKEKDSGVNLERNGEYPYTGDRPQRMQRATVALIERLSKERFEKQLKPDTATTDHNADLTAAIKSARTSLTEKRDAALKALLEAKDADKAAATQRLIDLQKQLDALNDKFPAAGKGAEIAEAMRRAHRTMRVTDEEWSAALRILREVLVLHSVPDQEAGELIDAVESLREDFVYGL
jgi:tetratricopeptide (TPR) repeat protein